MREQIAIVMTEVFLRRLTPSLIPFVRRQHDFRILSIRRPIEELKVILEELQPKAIITEWLPETTEQLLDLNIPTVIADTDITYPHLANVISIDVDDWQVGREAARAFAQAGYQHFACLGNHTPYSDQRIEGFTQELSEQGKKQPHIHHEATAQNTLYSEDFAQPSPELKRWLEALPKPTGILAVHDPLGRYLCSICAQLNIRIPEDIAIIGANNDELVCGLSHPMLSSVAIPWDTIGAKIGETIHSIITSSKTSNNESNKKQLTSNQAILIPPSNVVLRHSANHLAIEDTTMRRAMTYLSDHLLESITIESMCTDLHIARRTLEHKFKEYLNTTPWQTLCKLRITRAKQLLAQTNHPISIIAELSGFNDPERLTVVFKRLEKTTPTSYRKTIQT